MTHHPLRNKALGCLALLTVAASLLWAQQSGQNPAIPVPIIGRSDAPARPPAPVPPSDIRSLPPWPLPAMPPLRQLGGAGHYLTQEPLILKGRHADALFAD